MITITLLEEAPKTCHDCRFRTMRYADKKGERLVNYCILARAVVNNSGSERNKTCPINEENYG